MAVERFAWGVGERSLDTHVEGLSMLTFLIPAGRWLRHFGANESGLVTVEWVALAGAVLIGGITVAWLVLNGLQTPANNVGTNLTSCESIAAANSGDTSTCP